MATNLKPFHYIKGRDEALDMEYAAAQKYGKVSLGQNHLFWRVGLTWYRVPFSQIRRIYRSLMPMHGKLCAGGYSFDLEYLTVLLRDGTSLRIHIGSDVKAKAVALLDAIQQAQPQLEYGKPPKEEA